MWHKFWISILANATEDALAGVKVKIDGEWYRPVMSEDKVWYENESGPLHDVAGPITEIRMPLQLGLSIGGLSECGH